MATLTPVEGNPFEPTPSASGSGPRLTPVDGDPFKRDFGIDWSKPVSDVRAAIARLPEGDRQEAMTQWADAYVARERQGDAGIMRNADDTARLVSRGTFVGSWLDEANAATSGALNRVTGGLVGAPYDESVAYQRALDRAIDRDWGWGGTALQVGGGLASAGGGLALAGPRLAATGMPGRIAAGSAAGATGGFVYGSGAAEGGPEERLAAGANAAPIGAVIGAAAPPVMSAVGAVARPAIDWASPTVARLGANARNAMSGLEWNTDRATLNSGFPLPFRRQPVPMAASDDAGAGFARTADDAADGGGASSAGGAPPSSNIPLPPMSPGDRAAAETVAANALLRGGVRPDQLRGAFGNPDDTTRFYSNSYAQDARMPVDLSQTLQRLASSAARDSPEAGTIAAATMRARQTGLTPADAAERAIVAEAGIPTREAMARVGKNDRPAGQLERIRDGFRRALTIEDATYHRHLATGRRTEDAILAEARKEADKLYTAAYTSGQSADIAGTLAPVFQKWQAELSNQAEPVQALLSRLMASFGRSRNLEQFDRNKRYLLDAKIEQLRNSPVGRNPETARVLTQFKREMLDAMDNASGFGASYREARDAFESQMTLRDALRAGREAFREQSEVGVDAYRALQTEGERKLFRLGMLDSFTDRASSMKSGADKLQLFDNDRIRQILAHVIPRTETATGRAKANAVFADRPQRFGRWLEGEGRMVQTRNEVVGNSKTAQRMADDEAYSSLNSITEIFSTSGLTQAGLRAAEKAIKSVFGRRQDTSAALARMLFTADPVRRQQNIEAIVRRMGASRTQKLAELLNGLQPQLGGVAGRGAVAGLSPQP